MGAKASIQDRRIQLSGKGIEDIEADVPNVDLFADYTGPRSLDLSHNKISDIPPRICRAVSRSTSITESLLKVDLSHNRLKRLNNAFFLLVNVVKLKLDHNLLEAVPSKLASSLYKLEFLSLDHNHLESIPWNIDKMNRLEILRFDNNDLRFVPNTLGDLGRLKELTLSGNVMLPVETQKGSLDKRLTFIRQQKLPERFLPDQVDKKKRTDSEMCFQVMLDTPELAARFEEFIIKEFAGENLYFWRAVSDFRATYSSDIAIKTRELVNDAYKIYDKFLAPECPYFINVPAKVNDPIQEAFSSSANMTKCVNQWIFNDAHDSIFQLMYGDTYEQRFRWTPEGEEVTESAVAILDGMKTSGAFNSKAWMFN